MLQSIRRDSAFWRKAVDAGVMHGPEAFVRLSPRAIGRLFFALSPSARDSVLNVLALLRPRAGQAELVRHGAEVFANFASTMTDGMLLARSRRFEPTTRVLGSALMRHALDEGGLIVATAHTSGWDVIGPIFRQKRNVDVIVVMARENDPHAQEIHDEARQRSGVRIVHVGDDPLSALELMRHLRSGGVVAMQIDRTPPKMRSVAVTFRGRSWRIPAGPFHLAAASGAPILPAFGRRLGFMDYEINISAPLTLPRRPTEQQLAEAAQALSARLEAHVLRYPTHWFCFDPNAAPSGTF